MRSNEEVKILHINRWRAWVPKVKPVPEQTVYGRVTCYNEVVVGVEAITMEELIMRAAKRGSVR